MLRFLTPAVGTVNAAVGVVASASDADATTNTITYSVDDSRFTVDPDGTVRVASGASFDYETEQSIDIVVTATSADGSSSNQTFTLAVTDVNESGVSAISDTDATLDAVDENSAIGTTVGVTAFASDADGTDSVTYSLSNSAGGLFAIDPNTGEVTVAGHDAADLSERRRTALRRDHIAFVYQSANLLPSLTAVEQLQLVGHIRGERPSSTRARALALLDDLGLADRANQLPTELSGGERQRVGVARALIAEPAVLIADEPTASLDPARADSVAELLASAAHDRGIATLVVAHDDATRRRADRHLRLVDGRLRDESAAAGAADVGR